MTTKPMTLLKFVEEVTSRLGSHCDTLNRDKSTGDFATRLAVELLLINYWLRKRSDDPRIECDEEIRQELQSLLGKLVDICTVSPISITQCCFQPGSSDSSGFLRERLVKIARTEGKKTSRMDFRICAVSKTRMNGSEFYFASTSWEDILTLSRPVRATFAYLSYLTIKHLYHMD